MPAATRTPRPRPLFARLYTRMSATAEKSGAAEHRDRLLSGLSGEVVEVGAGNGLNFGHYPTTVAKVTAIEPEPFLRRRAQQAAADVAVDIALLDGSADRIPLADRSVDAGVASLVLCSVPDQSTALTELRRVIRPGGELRFYEHVATTRERWAKWQRRVDPVWTRFAGGCHLTRSTADAIRAAGFEIEACEEFLFSVSVFDRLGAQHILGRARKPAAED